MKTLHTDVAVIGAGTAGLAAYRAARAAGKRALLIEGGPYGTTCARVGCMPSKLLIAAAEAAHAAMHTDAFGVRVEGEVSADGKAVMDRVKRERDRFVGFVLDGVENIPAEDKIRGQARFVSDTVLRVDEHAEIQASRVVIATGSRPSVPPPLRDLGDRLVVNDDVFAWDDLPRRVAVFGPGVIGLELVRRWRAWASRCGCSASAAAWAASATRWCARAPARSSSASSTWIRTPACWKPGASAMRSRCATWRWTTASAPSALTMRWSPPAAAPTWTGWAWSTPRWH